MEDPVSSLPSRKCVFQDNDILCTEILSCLFVIWRPLKKSPKDSIISQKCWLKSVFHSKIQHKYTRGDMSTKILMWQSFDQVRFFPSSSLRKPYLGFLKGKLSLCHICASARFCCICTALVRLVWRISYRPFQVISTNLTMWVNMQSMLRLCHLIPPNSHFAWHFRMQKNKPRDPSLPHLCHFSELGAALKHEIT